jgi:hypothetical protein
MNMAVRISLNQILKTLIVLFINNNYAQHPAIDPEHHRKVPDCGTKPDIPSARIINVEESKVHDPWVIRVTRYYKEEYLGECGGSIITKRYHNICNILRFCTYLYLLAI